MRRHRPRWTACAVAALVGIAIAAVVPGRPVGGGGEFVPLDTPVRLLDTRPGTQTIDGAFAGIGLRAADSTLLLDVAGRAGVPVDAANVVLNVTAVEARGWGFITVHPDGTARPNASNLNYDTGQTIANTVITPVGFGGRILLYTYGPTHLLVDAIGHLPDDAIDSLPAAARLLDTRPGTATIDGTGAGIGRRDAGSTLRLKVAGRAGIPVDATSVVLNVTAALPEGWGFLTVHPTGTARPNASNLNYDTGQTIANTVVTRLGLDGHVSIYTYAATHLIVDVAGQLAPDTFTPLQQPARLVDSRLGAATIDGQQAGLGLRPAKSSLRVNVAGRAGVPADAASVVLNVAAVDALGWGFVTEFPTGTGRPNASNLNYDAGTTIANTVVARLGAGGDVCVFTYGPTHLIVDVIGHLTGPPPPIDGADCPPLAYGPARPLAVGVTASDINNRGIIVGTDYHGSAEDSDALWWPTPGGGPRLVPVVADARSSFALAVNDRDQVLVGTDSDDTGFRLFVVDLTTGGSSEFSGLVDVAGLEGSDVLAVGLNDRGEVALEALGPEQGVDAVAVWSSATGAIDTHPELLRDSYPRAINDLGDVVGASSSDAFYWDRQSDTVHRLDAAGFPVARATGVNDRGQVVGVVSDERGDGRTAFWAHRSAAPILLDGPAVVDINEAGLVVHLGTVGTRPSPIWDSTSDRWIDVPVSTEHWLVAINDVGQVVGGIGHEQPALWYPA